MFHFVIGVAVCIWIAERVAHYRYQRRHREHVSSTVWQEGWRRTPERWSSRP